jgi:hypothetical protein
MKILIVDKNEPLNYDSRVCDVVVYLKENRFDIVKNRYGIIGQDFPIYILEKFLKNPQGAVKIDWE